MLVLSGATLVLPDRLLSPGTLVIDGGRIADIRQGAIAGGEGASLPLQGHLIVPGFVDVHLHGLHGVDTLDGEEAVSRIAALLPRHGVTAFCPTSVACAPPALRRFLDEVRRTRAQSPERAARVLPAHLESNFINPDYAGAQPSRCLRSARAALDRLVRATVTRTEEHQPPPDSAADGYRDDGWRGDGGAYDGDDILREIATAAPDVGTVTVAPEMDGALELIQWLVAGGHRVSLGHSGASYNESVAAIAAGARQATHLFNRMPPVNHREPGLAGAVLQSPDVAAELICDGVHVHPGMIRAALAAKGVARVMAITDGTSAAGLPIGSRARLGEQTIVAGARSAVLDDGTLAGSTVTMDRVFNVLVNHVGVSLIDAVTICSTTPARELSLTGHGVLAAGAVADFVVMAPDLTVIQTYVQGRMAWPL